MPKMSEKELNWRKARATREVDTVGTGEGLVKTPLALRLQLKNTPIDEANALAFVDLLKSHYGFEQYNIKVSFSLRVTYRRWGTAFYRQRRIILYRHDIATFLHELAHIVEFLKWGSSGHGERFAGELDYLFGLAQGLLY